MTLSVMFLVLVAALLHASWNAFVKAGNDKLLSIGLMHACSGLLGLCLLPFFPCLIRPLGPISHFRWRYIGVITSFSLTAINMGILEWFIRWPGAARLC